MKSAKFFSVNNLTNPLKNSQKIKDKGDINYVSKKFKI